MNRQESHRRRLSLRSMRSIGRLMVFRFTSLRARFRGVFLASQFQSHRFQLSLPFSRLDRAIPSLVELYEAFQDLDQTDLGATIGNFRLSLLQILVAGDYGLGAERQPRIRQTLL